MSIAVILTAGLSFSSSRPIYQGEPSGAALVLRQIRSLGRGLRDAANEVAEYR